MTNEKFATEREAVEEMAMLGDEHLEAIAALGADITVEGETADECRLEQQGNGNDDRERTDKLEHFQGFPDADPEEGREETEPGGDTGGGVPEDGDTEGPGEVHADESAAEAESSAKESLQGNEAETDKDSQGNEAADGSEDDADKAVQKLKGWKQANKHPYATLICNHLIKRCGEDAGFAQDVIADNKTFDGCYGFIKDKARRKAENGCACVEGSIVYEWAEDYIRRDETSKAVGSDNVHKSKKDADKSTGKRAKKAKSVQKTAKNARSATANAQATEPETAPATEPEKEKTDPATQNVLPDNENTQEVTENAAPATESKEEKPETKKPKAKSKASEPKKEPKAEKSKKEKKDKNEMEGQIDLFSLFG